MPSYLHWLDILTNVLGAVAILCALVIKKQGQSAKGSTKFLGLVSGGLCLCSLASTMAIPALRSARKTLTGAVTGFHEVRQYRSSSFHFVVDNGKESSGELYAHYFDKGFFFGDPSVSNGDIIIATYLDWTKEVIEIKELSGRHTGWTFAKDPSGPGPWVFGFVGVAMIVAGVLGVVSDIMARPSGDRSGRTGDSGSTSILGL
jgi:hypothetical protein